MSSNSPNIFLISLIYWFTFNMPNLFFENSILQRIFDFDDWNSASMAEWNPYYVTEERFIDWWWWKPDMV